MAISPLITPTRPERAVAALNVIAGRASAARPVMSSALELLDASRAIGEVRVPEIARERLARLLLEVAAKVNEFQREIEALKDAQPTT